MSNKILILNLNLILLPPSVDQDLFVSVRKVGGMGDIDTIILQCEAFWIYILQSCNKGLNTEHLLGMILEYFCLGCSFTLIDLCIYVCGDIFYLTICGK